MTVPDPGLGAILAALRADEEDEATYQLLAPKHDHERAAGIHLGEPRVERLD